MDDEAGRRRIELEALVILTDDMKRVVTEQRLGHVATVCPDGTPNLSPKGTTMVWDDNTLIFADLRSPRTIQNLLQNPSIEINVIDPIIRKGYRFKGNGTVVRDGALFESALRFYDESLGLSGLSSAQIRAVVFVKVTRVLPLISPAYDRGRDEVSVKRQWIQHYLDLWGLSAVDTTEFRDAAADAHDRS